MSDTNQLIEVLDLNEDELCAIFDSDPLAVIGGELDGCPDLQILIALLNDATERIPIQMLRRWLRTGPSKNRPIDHLITKDFVRFEAALEELVNRGLILQSPVPAK